MLEALLVFGLVGALALLGFAAVLVSFEQLILLGFACIAAGFCLGVPAGTYYHLKLYRALSLRGAVPGHFWLSPTRYHHHLEPRELRLILPWFLAGGVGFGLVVLGCVVMLVGVLRGGQLG